MNSSFERVDKNIVFTYSYIGGPGFFSYQSYTFDFAEWVTLLTLCFAPLLAHVIMGVLCTAYLGHSRPRWHDLVPLYHPATILWRYMVLVDRRMRAMAWDVGDLAAANTVFWTSDGWAGDEYFAVYSRRYLTRPPEIERLRSFMSSETLGTVITTLQGLQAAYLLVCQLSIAGPSSVKGATMANVFGWLSTLGLLRVPAAAWVSKDFAYTFSNLEGLATLTAPKDEIAAQETTKEWHRVPSDSHLEDDSMRYTKPGWQSYLLRSSLLMFGMGMTVYSFYFNFVQSLFYYEKIYATTTQLSLLPLYLLLVAPTTILFGASIYRRPENGLSTVMPCIGTWWYKVYVILWFLFAADVVVVSAVETTIDRCGHYTSAPFQPLTCRK